MIRTTLISAAALLAFAGAAHAAPFGPTDVPTLKISVAGKTEAAVKTEVGRASRAVCVDVADIEYSACVRETYRDAMAQLARIMASRTANLTF